MKRQSLRRTRTPAWKLQLLGFCYKYRNAIHLAFGGTLAYVLNLPTAAQANCVGFMCGARNGLLSDRVVASSEFMKGGVNFLFVAANAVLAFVFLFGLIFVIIKLIERENYVTPGIIFIVAMFGVVIVNWASGYLFGNTTGATATPNGPGGREAAPEGLVEGARIFIEN